MQSPHWYTWPWHVATTHVSMHPPEDGMQSSPGAHFVLSAVCTQPCGSVHDSTVHAIPSSAHVGGGPALQPVTAAPPEAGAHTSAPLQTMPS